MMTSPTASQSQVSTSSATQYTLHAKHGRATYVRSDVSDAARVSSSPCCDVICVGLTAAYDTVLHTGLLYKLSKTMPYWFTRHVSIYPSAFS